MISDDWVGKVLIVIQIIEGMIGIYAFAVAENKVLIGCIFLLVFLIISLLFILYSREMYIRFIEFLFENEHHKFELLPEMRMYLNTKKIANKVKYNSVSVTYDIKHKKSEKSQLLGDLDIIYNLDIKNEKVPRTFYFLTGNDYSNKPPKLLYKYGKMQDYNEVSADKVNCAKYKRTAIREFKIEFDKSLIENKGNFKLEMKISYEESFEFEHISMDTIICLPKIFGDDIPSMKYTINIIDFPPKETYHLFSYIIAREGFCYLRKNIGHEADADRRRFVITFQPNDVKGEQAYYFRLGRKDFDEELEF